MLMHSFRFLVARPTVISCRKLFGSTRMGPRCDLLRKPCAFALVSDLDWTMVNHNDATHEDLLRFNRLWVSELAHDSLLVFSTGRSPELFKELGAEVPLLTPDILVCSVGTEILINGQPDEEWEAYLNEGWDRQKAASVAARLPDLVLQQPSEQRPHKVSYKLHAPTPQHAHQVVEALRGGLAEAGLGTNVVFSAGVDVDILPSRASKGRALAFLLRQLEQGGGRPARGVLVCGDSGNDIELFAVPGVHGCMVANAHGELREWCEAHGGEWLFKATADGPGGILQAIEHFGFVPGQQALAPAPQVLLRRELVRLHEDLETWVSARVPRASPDALPAHLDRLLTPDYEHINSEGKPMARAGLLGWWREGRYGCEADLRSIAPDPRSQPANDSPSAAAEGDEGAEGAAGGSTGPGTGAGAHRYRVWLDQFREREVGPGLWLARYVELHQPFTAGAHTAGNRTARCVSVLLREAPAGGGEGAGGFQALMSHETRIPLAAAHPEVAAL